MQGNYIGNSLQDSFLLQIQIPFFFSFASYETHHFDNIGVCITKYKILALNTIAMKNMYAVAIHDYISIR